MMKRTYELHKGMKNKKVLFKLTGGKTLFVLKPTYVRANKKLHNTVFF